MLRPVAADLHDAEITLRLVLQLEKVPRNDTPPLYPILVR
jgi:hypothetical protein